LAKFAEGKSELTNSHLTLDGALAAIAEPKPKPARKLNKPKKWEPANQVPSPAPKPAEALIVDEPMPHPIEPEPEAGDQFEQPTPGRPRLDLNKLEEIKRQYLELTGVDRNAFARWVLEHQLRQTDLTPHRKASLAHILKVLTTYSGGSTSEAKVITPLSAPHPGIVARVASQIGAPAKKAARRKGGAA
jgi:hypothetical protein